MAPNSRHSLRLLVPVSATHLFPPASCSGTSIAPLPLPSSLPVILHAACRSPFQKDIVPPVSCNEPSITSFPCSRRRSSDASFPPQLLTVSRQSHRFLCNGCLPPHSSS